MPEKTVVQLPLQEIAGWFAVYVVPHTASIQEGMACVCWGVRSAMVSTRA
jgi:hypothetical protein